ncbi:DUF99 family protein [Chroogloeocystis siderophila]|uniref:endonuclease dU n=1 Tax=Chroogloeocystis siderophila TaxID=329163 RepID=UPI000AAAB803|nr:DUF99 family protein [Chroogloeocystis siderophila]
MDLDALLRRRRRTIRVVGFDDAPFSRPSKSGKVSIAGVVCADTRFEGMVWGEVQQDGWDVTQIIYRNLPKGYKYYNVLVRFIRIHPFSFKCLVASPEVTFAVLQRLTNCGKVPEALRLAHLIGAAVVKGESGKSA